MYQRGYFIEGLFAGHSAFLKFIFGPLAVGYVVQGYDRDCCKRFAVVRDIVYGALEIFLCRMSEFDLLEGSRNIHESTFSQDILSFAVKKSLAWVAGQSNEHFIAPQ